ncbi:hypothetical protein VTL71DRAFT_12946 [Oculimacula yallundae]|uniref:MYND-type domain-containing protein n=1 Tax=Oculimacula yallundae TaxID=86028 RepID=A0ABR4CNX6_9HELO
MSLSLTSSCPTCLKTDKLLRCQGCKVMFYCSKEHQTADRSAHKTACNAVKKAGIKCNAEETKLRNHPGDFMTPANPFENAVGRFWGILDTRDYMRSKYGVVEALLKIKTRVAVQEALTHVLDILRLNRSDNMGVRSAAPALFLRLGKDQECYDFIKWWATCDPDGTYDWGDMTLPYLSTKDADPLESEDIFSDAYGDLSITSSVVLIKLRLLMEVKSLQNSTLLRSKIPSELVKDIQDGIAGPILARYKNIMSSAEQRSVVIKNLESQVDKLYKDIAKMNPHFWPAVVNPGAHLTARPEYSSRGTKEEMQISLQQCYDAWAETPGAIDFIREKL